MFNWSQTSISNIVVADVEFPHCVKEKAKVDNGMERYPFLTQPRNAFLGVVDEPKGDSFRFGHDT